MGTGASRPTAVASIVVRTFAWQQRSRQHAVTPIEDTLAVAEAPASGEEWQPAPGSGCLPDGAPKQILRAATPAFMRWLLGRLGALGANVTKLTTHDAVHGAGAEWQESRFKRSGFGYGPPATPACIRALTAPGKTSLYYFVTEHPAGEPMRMELHAAFGDNWQRVCFGRATHFLSHAWDMPFAGFIDALADLPPDSFVWNDILAINQHGDAGPLARRAMQEDLGSLEPVIRHTKRIILYFDPINEPAAIKRVWCVQHFLGRSAAHPVCATCSHDRSGGVRAGACTRS